MICTDRNIVPWNPAAQKPRFYILQGAVFTVATVFLLILLPPAAVSAEVPADLYPVIRSMAYGDLNYRQLQEDVEFFYRSAGAGNELPPLMFYIYSAGQNDNIFTVAASAGLPYEAIVTLNRLSNADTELSGRRLLIPSQPGLFIPEQPQTELEFIESSWRGSQIADAETVRPGDSAFRFLPGESFHPVERAYFLQILFRNPLPDGIISSSYGIRNSPFGGHRVFHNGIDIAAPPGTPVYAAREGTVIAVGSDTVFGNYIEIEHQGGYSSFYGHLNKFFVELHDQVNSSMIIAEVGSTGRSTGPHLHFEIRRDGKSKDPEGLTSGLD